jgi:hypothetical protein
MFDKKILHVFAQMRERTGDSGGYSSELAPENETVA